jgi:hypothetical protein
MISEEAIEAYNTRLTVDVSSVDRLSPSQRDAVKTYGSQAETLLKSRELGQFIHHYKFLLADIQSELSAHTAEANAERVAIANQLVGVTGFVNSLKRAVYYKNKVVAWEQNPPLINQKSELKQVFDPNR